MKKTILGKYLSTVLPIFVYVGVVLSPVSAYASTVDLLDVSNSEASFGKPDHAPPVNPPIDTPAFNNGLVNAPDIMPPSVPSDTLLGSKFGQAAVPVPAAAWLFGFGLLGLIGVSRRKKSA